MPNSRLSLEFQGRDSREERGPVMRYLACYGQSRSSVNVKKEATVSKDVEGRKVNKLSTPKRSFLRIAFILRPIVEWVLWMILRLEASLRI
jgi:hypothetical protein